jgi:hypothetical protein
MTIQTVAILVGVGLALTGYLATYMNNLLAERRREKLAFINKQLTAFYGPLYVVSVVGRTAYDALVSKLSRHHDPNLDSPLAEAELAEWRLWVMNVFMPMNLWCERILLENAHLLRERDIPPCMLQFVTHVSAYKAVVKKWEAGDYSEQFSLIDFPEELRTFATQAYLELKTEQLRLIGKVQGGQ